MRSAPPKLTSLVMPTLLIADDHPLFRTALRQAVMESVADCVINEATDLPTALAALAAVSTPMSARYSSLVGMRPSLEQIAANSALPR